MTTFAHIGGICAHTLRLAVAGATTLAGISEFKIAQGGEPTVLVPRIVVQNGDIAWGTDGVDGRPTGLFAHGNGGVELDAPVGSREGHFAFAGSARFEDHPSLPPFRGGLWNMLHDVPSTVGLAGLPAPTSPGMFTGEFGSIVLNRDGELAFVAKWQEPEAPFAIRTGIWWAKSFEFFYNPSPVPEIVALEGTTGTGGSAPFGSFWNTQILHNDIFIAFANEDATWILTKSGVVERATYAGLEVGFGSDYVLSEPGDILGLSRSGYLLVTAATTSGASLLLEASTSYALPLMASGEAAPEIPGYTVTSITAALSYDVVTILAGLEDGDGSPDNKISALYLLRGGELHLIARSDTPPVGMPQGEWTGPLMMSDGGYIHVAGGLLRPPINVGDLASYTSIPQIPGSFSGPTSTVMNLNAMGQLGAYVVDAGAPSLWLYDAANGWRVVARQGVPLATPNWTTPIVDVGFAATWSGGSDGKPTGLTADGALFFSVNGTHILSVGDPERIPTNFEFTGDLDQNWHTAGTVPPTNWLEPGLVPTKQAPGDVARGIANVAIANQIVTIDQRDVEIAALTLANSELRIRGTGLIVREDVNADSASKFVLDSGILELRRGGPMGILSGTGILRLNYGSGGVFPYRLRLLGGRSPDIEILDSAVTLEFVDPEPAVVPSILLNFGRLASGTGTLSGATLQTTTLDWFDGQIGTTAEPLRLTVTNGTAHPGISQKGINRAVIDVTSRFVQRDHLWLTNSAIEIHGTWIVDRTADVIANDDSIVLIAEPAATLSSGGTLLIGDPSNPPTTPATVRFYPRVDNRGEVVVDTVSGSSLTLLGGIAQRDQSRLIGGRWTVGSGNALDVSGANLDVIGLNARVLMKGAGDFLQLRPRRVEGAYLLQARMESISSDLDLLGELSIDSESVLTVTGNVLQTAGGRLQVDGELRASSIQLNGTVSGNGTIKAGTVTFEGVVNPGSSPGLLRINGDASFRLASDITVEISGAGIGQFDRINVTGSAILAGRLMLNLDGGFLPAPTDTFSILESSVTTGRFSNVAKGTRLFTTDNKGSFVVRFGPGSPTGETRVVLTDFLLAAPGETPPAITALSIPQPIIAGSPLHFTVAASGTGSTQYQWFKDGVAIPGATFPTYDQSPAQRFFAGQYSVAVSNTFGSFLSAVNAVSIQAPPSNTARLLNLSTRAQALTGDDVIIPGFVVAGTGNKRLLIRAVGPTLGKPPFNLGGVLPDPRMRLLKRNTTAQAFEEVAANDNWATNPNAAAITQTAADLFAFAFNDALESALLMDLTPGEYTVIASGVNNATGVAMVELYDADPSTGSGQAPAAKLINISNRGFAGVGAQVMIPGFVISSEGPKTLLVRVVGPTLGTFGVGGTMTDPKLEVFPGGASTPILTNDNWGDNPDSAYTAQIASQLFAFPLTAGSKDAAFVVTLPPGSYTVVGSSATPGGTGVVLVEVYVVP